MDNHREPARGRKWFFPSSMLGSNLERHLLLVGKKQRVTLGL